jgi:hypothetical protein
LTNSQQQNDYLQAGQLRIGLILTEKHRNKGYGRQAVQEALKIAFQDQQCTRVQAILIDGPCKDRALGLFMKRCVPYLSSPFFFEVPFHHTSHQPHTSLQCHLYQVQITLLGPKRLLTSFNIREVRTRES